MTWGSSAWGALPWGAPMRAGVVTLQQGVAFLTGNAIDFFGGTMAGAGTAQVGILTGNLIHFYEGELAQISEYQWTQGTINLTRGSPIVAGLGTGWSGQVTTADLLLAHLDDPTAGLMYEVLSVQADEQLTLAAPWQGPTAFATPYLIHRRHGSLPRLSGDDEGLAQIITYALIRIDAAIQGGAPPSLAPWILDSGTWDDAGQWIDTDTWQDS